jgi:hypothetical protein
VSERPDPVGDLGMPIVPVEKECRESRGARALEILGHRVADVQRFSGIDPEPPARAVEDLGVGLAGLFDRRHGHDPEELREVERLEELRQIGVSV